MADDMDRYIAARLLLGSESVGEIAGIDRGK